MKKILCSIIILLITFFVFVPVNAETRPEFYPKLTVVFEIETVGNLRIVNCIDSSQNVWSFYDDDNEWEIGDIANLLMWALNEKEEDDEIVEVYYEGHTPDIHHFLKLMGEWN